MQLANSYFQKQDYPNAIFYYEIALQFSPESEEALTRIAASYFNFPALRQKCILYATRARHINPKNFEPRMMLAHCYFEEKRYDSAYAILEFLEKDYPQCEEAKQLRNQIREAAKGAFEDANKHAPSCAHEYAAGRFDGILNYKEDPTDPHSRHYWTFNPVLIDPVIPPGPKDIAMLENVLNIANTFFEEKNYPYAVFHYQIALENHARCEQALERIAASYFSHPKAFSICIEYSTRLNYINSSNFRSNILRAECYIAREQFMEALPVVNALTDKYPDCAEAWELQSKTYLGLGFSIPALDAAEKWVALEPTSAEAVQQRSLALQAEDERRKRLS